MGKKKKITVIKESDSGRNQKFRDESTGEEMTRSDFVKEIEKGNYPDYHVRKTHNIKTPASNPDKSEKNNLG